MSITAAPAEDLSTLEEAWGPKKATAVYNLFAAEGAPSRTETAEKAEVSLGFVQELTTYKVTLGRGKAKYANRKRDDVLKVLKVLKVSEKKFIESL